MVKRFSMSGFNILAVAVLGLASMSAKADFIGLYAGVDGMYSQNTTDRGNKDNDSKWNGVYSLALEHPIPFIPNAKLRYSDFNSTSSYLSGSRYLTENLEIQTLDAIAYYEILDNIISLDAGLGVKRVDADKKDRSTLNELFLRDANETIPALYLAAGGKLPFTGFSAKAEVMAGKNSDADFNDINAEVKYNFIENIALDLGVKFGYRAMTINFDEDSDSNFNKIEAKGPYVGLEAHF